MVTSSNLRSFARKLLQKIVSFPYSVVMPVNALTPSSNFQFAVAKKVMAINEQVDQQALSLIQGATASGGVAVNRPEGVTGPGNAPMQTNGLHIVA